MMKTVFEYTRENILVIPQALYAMKDVSVVMQGANSVMFLKHLEHDLVDVEFYTNYPCFVYIESGCEVLTNAQNEVIELQAGSAIFLPQGATLHSDYVKQTQSLRACLVFFDQQ
ncbi:MAG TPA: AraC family transcriptional regulator, partial [Gammaproteobacteria bacterium]|nr:AraC family transcriptional regulator [Gammaproteobacteria bacterium]